MTLAVGQVVPRALADSEVRDATGALHRLGELWRDRDAVIAFVRHFGCAGCAEHVGALRPRLAELGRLDVGVAIVGNGSPDQLAAFIEREDLGGVPTFTDPSLAVYRAAELARSAWGTFGPRALAQLARARLRGSPNGSVEGDHYQQGGTLYIAKDGLVVFYDRATHLGDHASLGDVVDVALARRALEAVL